MRFQYLSASTIPHHDVCTDNTGGGTWLKTFNLYLMTILCKLLKSELNNNTRYKVIIKVFFNLTYVTRGEINVKTFSVNNNKLVIIL